jgi:cell division transport system ATP-binding protein
MTENRSDSPIIRMFHVYKRFGKKNALADITLDVKQNEMLLISGPSGAGKSTLLKLLYLGETLSDGQILIDGMNLSRISNNRIPILRRKFGIIFQDYKLIQTKTVYENIALVLEVKEMKPRFIQKKVHSVLRTVGMEERQKAYPPSLSGGEQQRIAVARAVVGEPKIILADEPTGSLDPESAGVILDLLYGFHARGTTVIIATHDREIIRKATGNVVYLKEGRLQELLQQEAEKKETTAS